MRVQVRQTLAFEALADLAALSSCRRASAAALLSLSPAAAMASENDARPGGQMTGAVAREGVKVARDEAR